MGGGGALFTLELIAQAVKGSAGASLLSMLQAQPEGSGTASSLRPALGLRLLDLPPVVIDAPEAEGYGTSSGSRVAFAGRGKALVFEFPDLVDSQLSKPLPLWLMALARKTDPDSPSVLMASACVDFRDDLMHAAAQAKHLGGKAGVSSPCPFKRCSFRMTPVRDAGCALTVECYVRLYAGSQRPVTGGELLLEPSAVLPEAPRSVLTHCVAETQTEPPEQPPVEEDPAQKKAIEVAPSPKASRRSPSPKASRSPLSQTSSGTFFPAEIRVGNISRDKQTNGAAAGLRTSREASPSSPKVTSSLPLVSELVRELWQIKEIN